MPGTAVRGSIKTADVVAPALSNFVKTTGGIIGEGLAYATDPYEFLGGRNNIREQYKAGNLDILPTVSKTTQKGLLKDTVAAGLETAIIRSVPSVLQKKLATRVGVGALEGVGFAIAEGMARDQSADEIVKNMGLYGVSGSALNIILPWIGPLLRKELGKAPAGLKAALKKEAEAPPQTQAAPASPTVGQAVPTSPTAPVARTVDGVQGEQLPIGGETKGLSQLEHRVLAKTDDPAYVAGYQNYINDADNLDGPEVSGSANPEQLKRSAAFVETLTPDEVQFYIDGGELPEGLLRTAFLKEAADKALLEGNAGAVNAIARRLGQLARRFGQEIQFTKNFDELDPATNIADLLGVRLKAAERRMKGTKTARGIVKSDVKQGAEEVSKNQLKIEEAEKLLDSILC
jgi:hypothetical protein